MEFKEKVVLITGAATGIGRACALAFAKEGADVIVADINEREAAKTVSDLKELGSNAIFIKSDVSSYESVENMVNESIETLGQIDIALNNAGIGGSYAKTGDVALKDWDKVMAINTNGVFYGMKLQIQQMLKQGSGVILNTSSIAGLRAMSNGSAYVASKHAVVGLTKTAAVEYAKYNIRINALCPVFTVSPLFNPEVMDQIKPGISAALKNTIPMKRFSTVEEMAQVALFLCSEKASFITGLAMPVDGGQTA